METEKELNLALLDYKSGKLMLSGQIRQLIIVRKGGAVELRESGDSPAKPDMDDKLANFDVEASVQLQPGDGVVLYTQRHYQCGKYRGGAIRVGAIMRVGQPSLGATRRGH